jgi:hypothetical protein
MVTKCNVRHYTTAFEHGNEQRTYQNSPDDRCEMETLTGRELAASQVLASEVQFRLKFYYRPQYKANMQVLIGSRVFEVVYPAHDEQWHMWTHLYVKEVNPA